MRTAGGVWRLCGHLCQAVGRGLSDLLQGAAANNALPCTGDLVRQACNSPAQCHFAQESQLAKDNAAEAEQLAAELPQKHRALVNKTRYATPASVQMRVLMRRFLLVGNLTGDFVSPAGDPTYSRILHFAQLHVTLQRFCRCTGAAPPTI